VPQAQIELPNGQMLQIIYVETHGYSRAYFNSKRWGLRIPVKSAADSETKSATYSDFIPATIPI